jgi:antitoxin (DNA-binding transcriptional repressor) of toxin-antitoxin stability system
MREDLAVPETELAVSPGILSQGGGDVDPRDLRDHGGEVIDRVALGEEPTITRDGKRVAQLRPVDRAPLSVTVLLRRWASLPPMDPHALRMDLDDAVDPAL